MPCCMWVLEEDAVTVLLEVADHLRQRVCTVCRSLAAVSCCLHDACAPLVLRTPLIMLIQLIARS